MIMTCIIGQAQVYYQDLFYGSVVAPDDGGPRRVGGVHKTGYTNRLTVRGTRDLCPRKPGEVNEHRSESRKHAKPAAPGEKENVIRLYLTGRTPTEISRETGRNAATIQNWICDSGFSRGRKCLTPEQDTTARQMLADGASIRQVCEATGIGHCTVQKMRRGER
jgi:transposase-like protein